MANLKSKKVVIVGGSLGGLFTGIVFTRLGFNVTILKRTPIAALKDQGADISLYIIIPRFSLRSRNSGPQVHPLWIF